MMMSLHSRNATVDLSSLFPEMRINRALDYLNLGAIGQIVIKIFDGNPILRLSGTDSNQLLQRIAQSPKEEEQLKRMITNIPWDNFVKAVDSAIRQQEDSTAEGSGHIRDAIALMGNYETLEEFENYLSRTHQRSHFFDSLEAALAHFIADHEPRNPWEAQQMIHLYAGGIAGLTSLFFAIKNIPEIASTGKPGLIAFAIVAGLVTTLYGGIRIYRWTHPVPNQIRPLKNLVQFAVNSRLEPIIGRDDTIDRIIGCWISIMNNPNTRQHPLLIGEAGVGKSAIMEEIARRIAILQCKNISDDESKILTSARNLLRKKHFFGGSASQLLPSFPGEGDNKLEYVLSRITSIKDKLILGLDEVHCFITAGTNFGERLKAILDTGPEGIPYMICATTNEEYNVHIRINSAFSRRFRPIFINELNQEHVMFLMQRTIMKTGSIDTVEDGFLSYIYRKTNELAREFSHLKQPQISQVILSATLFRMKETISKPPSEENLIQLQGRLHQFRRMNPFALSIENVSERANEMHTLQNQISFTQQQITQERENRAKYLNLLNKIQKCNQQLTVLGKSLLGIEDENQKDERKQFVFNFYYLRPYLLQEKERMKREFNIANIDTNLIDEEIHNYRETLQRISNQNGLNT